MREDALARIFDRFGRADAARTRSAGGVGLGLAIVDAIAKAHSGRCTVQNTGHGSIFALHLPAFTPGAELFERVDIDLAGVQGPVRDQRRGRHDASSHA